MGALVLPLMSVSLALSSISQRQQDTIQKTESSESIFGEIKLETEMSVNISYTLSI